MPIQNSICAPLRKSAGDKWVLLKGCVWTSPPGPLSMNGRGGINLCGEYIFSSIQLLPCPLPVFQPARHTAGHKKHFISKCLSKTPSAHLCGNLREIIGFNWRAVYEPHPLAPSPWLEEGESICVESIFFLLFKFFLASPLPLHSCRHGEGDTFRMH